MRLTAKEALDRGIIDKATAKQIEGSGKRSSTSMGDTVARLNMARLAALTMFTAGKPEEHSGPSRKDLPSQHPRHPSPGSREYRECDTSPQKILFDALCERLPGQPQWEVEKLIPDRRFSADIFVPPKVVVEMDGFRFHRSKPAFQSDRDRQNLFMMHGFRVVRAYAGQIFDKERLGELVELIVKTSELD